MDEIKLHLLNKPYCVLDFPFGKHVMVFKVKGRIYATFGKNRQGNELHLNLKCDPIKALELRKIHRGISPSYHLDKKHWNIIVVDGCLSQQFLLEMIDQSYSLVVKSLPKKVRLLMTLDE